MLHVKPERSTGQWTCVAGISHLWHFAVLFFRKRLTIQEALCHPWITVRLRKEAGHDQNRDDILTCIGMWNGKMPSKYLVTLSISEMCWEELVESG